MKMVMKAMVGTLLFLLPVVGSAQVETRTGTWFCTAEGLDPRTYERRQVSGDYALTQEKAEESALRWCQSLYMSCLVKSCFDSGAPFDTIETTENDTAL